jgi:branched-chain amino acid transport system substrate-binding protein
MRKPAFLALALAASVALAALPGAYAGHSVRTADPGITASSILIGGTSPLTGPAAAYASVARGAKAYFDSINAKGGVAKRRIDYKILDDAYNPAQTVQAVRQLVEQDKVFAVFNTLGTEVNLAIRDYLNGSKVPQLFAASGATTFGRDAATYPWTIGFQPSYQAEGWVLGQYLAKTRKTGRIAVLFQNDDYGKDLLGGLKRGLQRSGVKVVAAQSYEVTAPDVSSQIAKLKASRAGIFAIFATPKFAIQAYVFANRLGWRPLVINNAVSAASNIMLLASEGGKNRVVEGTVSLNFLKDPSDARWKKDPGMRTYRAIMSHFAKGANPGDVYHVYGMAVAYETVSLFKRLGANPTRAGLIVRVRSLNDPSNPFLLPGITVKTGKGDGFPIQQGQLQRWSKGRWVPFGALWTSKKL